MDLKFELNSLENSHFYIHPGPDSLGQVLQAQLGLGPKTDTKFGSGIAGNPECPKAGPKSIQNSRPW